jgi:hypothetical protein
LGKPADAIGSIARLIQAQLLYRSIDMRCCNVGTGAIKGCKLQFERGHNCMKTVVARHARSQIFQKPDPKYSWLTC